VIDCQEQTTEADVYVAQAVLDFSENKYDEALANLAARSTHSTPAAPAAPTSSS
jgi:isochorismate hydrolase